MRPAREKVMIAGILLIGVAVEQNQRRSHNGENRQPDQRAAQTQVISEISNHPGTMQITKGKNQKPPDFDFCPLPLAD
jgi:hypothetical protein